jgi:hypothetical protein
MTSEIVIHRQSHRRVRANSFPSISRIPQHLISTIKLLCHSVILSHKSKSFRKQNHFEELLSIKYAQMFWKIVISISRMRTAIFVVDLWTKTIFTICSSQGSRIASHDLPKYCMQRKHIHQLGVLLIPIPLTANNMTAGWNFSDFRSFDSISFWLCIILYCIALHHL